MLIDLKNRLGEASVQELIGYSVFPDPDTIKSTINHYRDQEDLKLIGFELDGNIIGLIGYSIDDHRILNIKHIAVNPLERGMGYGRVIIAELTTSEEPLEVHAETDHEIVDFYRNIGFEITSLGENNLGIERFKCVYRTITVD